MADRNLVVLCLDTVRKDYFDEYAPRLRERADLEFEQCRAASSWSVPSHASMFTGELPHQHGIHTHNRDFSVLSAEDTFLGDLPEHRSIGASANVWASSAFGFDEMFDEFVEISPDQRFSSGLHVGQFGQQCEADGIRRYFAFLRAAAADEHPLASLANGGFVALQDLCTRLPIANPLDDGAAIVSRELAERVEAGPEPFVAFGNLMDAHGPMAAIRGYDHSLHDAPRTWSSEDVEWQTAIESGDEVPTEQYTGLYAASIDYLDRTVCDLVDRIHADTARETTVVITSDHGDNLGTSADEKLWGHVESSLSEGLLHVPLLVLNAPDCDTAVDRYCSHTELRELLGALATGSVEDVTRDRIYAERIGHSGNLSSIENHRGTAADRMLRAAYDEGTKYVWDSAGGVATYDLDADRPCWQSAVERSFDRSTFESAFEVEIEEYKRRCTDAGGIGDVDETTRQRLEDLGYV